MNSVCLQIGANRTQSALSCSLAPLLEADYVVLEVLIAFWLGKDVRSIEPRYLSLVIVLVNNCPDLDLFIGQFDMQIKHCNVR